jgi:TatD DNase family protein
MMLIDTHAHIYEDDYADDRDKIIAEAVNKGVGRIIMPNIDATSIEAMLDVSRQHPGICFPMMGLHPTSVKSDYLKELDTIRQWLGKEKFTGIGEIGIDLYWDKTWLKEQQDAFRQQLRIAGELRLPVAIHVRNSFQEVYSILEEEQDGTLTGIFHCFSGGIEEAEKIVKAGFNLGIGGVVTFNNSKLADVLKEVDLCHLVLETDAPWLSPVPFRGRRNECSWLSYVADKLASIYNLPVEEVARITTANALSLFKIE